MRLPWKRKTLSAEQSAELKALSAEPAVLEALRDRRLNPYPPLGGSNVNITNAYQRGIDAQYGWMYATQPAVRSVIDFIARNAAQLAPPKLYKRKGDTERERMSDHPAQKLLAYPDGRTPGDSWFHRVFIDFLIFDNAFIVKFHPEGGDLTLLRLPPNGVTVAGGRFTPEQYFVWNEYGEALKVPPNSMIHWFGYHPDDPLRGLSKLETLRQELATDRAVQETMVELAKNGLKGGYIKRPLDAPMADMNDLLRIAELWKAGKLKGDPILDEGMEFVQSGVTPKDAEVIASRRFTEETVCAAYGVPPAAMGIGDSDPAEKRKLVYADVLPPYCNPLACMLNVGLLQQEFAAQDLYLEFDLNEKLRGDISERFSQYTAAAGAPWLLRNEIRAKENLPPIEGGDDLILPLNVAKEGEDTKPALPAPNVMPIQDPNKPLQDGSYREEPKGLKRWNPSQPRDELGRWEDGGGVGGGGMGREDSEEGAILAQIADIDQRRDRLHARIREAIESSTPFRSSDQPPSVGDRAVWPINGAERDLTVTKVGPKRVTVEWTGPTGQVHRPSFNYGDTLPEVQRYNAELDDLYVQRGRLAKRGRELRRGPKAMPPPSMKLVPNTIDPDHQITHYRPRIRADMKRQQENAAGLQEAIFKQYKRQEASTKSAKSAYDVARWTKEMVATIGPLIKAMVLREGDLYTARLGGDAFDDEEVEHWLTKMIIDTCAALNAATARDIESLGVEKAFKRASDQRAAIAGAQITAHATFFGRTEGAKQAPGAANRVQRWVANTDRHAHLEGKSVPLGETWEGGITPGSEPSCACGVSVE